MSCTQRGRPALTQIVKIRLARLDPIVELGVANIAAGNQNVERQADADGADLRGELRQASPASSRKSDRIGVSARREGTRQLAVDSNKCRLE